MKKFILMLLTIFFATSTVHAAKLTIKKILREIPRDAIILDKNAKIYSAGVGDMNDLLENPVLLGKLTEVEAAQ